jgi:hypothetical protein
MKKFILCFVLVFSASSVIADNLEITANFGGNTRTWVGPEYTEAKFQRFVDWLCAAYPELDGDGVPIDQPCTNVVAAQAFDQWAFEFHEQTKEVVVNTERNTASNTAVDAVNDFEPDGP